MAARVRRERLRGLGGPQPKGLAGEAAPLGYRTRIQRSSPRSSPEISRRQESRLERLFASCSLPRYCGPVTDSPAKRYPRTTVRRYRKGAGSNFEVIDLVAVCLSPA